MKRRSTIKDIASECGVSPTVVSAILRNSKGTVAFSEQTRLKVLEVAEKLEYSRNLFASSMVLRKSPIVALCLRCDQPAADATSINLYLYDQLTTAGFLLNEAGLEMLFIPFGDVGAQTRKLKALINSGAVGAAITNIIPGHDRPVTDFFKREGLPYVALGYDLDESVHSASIDNSATITRIIRHAAERSFADVYHVSSNPLRLTRLPFKSSSHYNEPAVPPAEVDFQTAMFAAFGKDALEGLQTQWRVPDDNILLVEDPRMQVSNHRVDRLEINSRPTSERLMRHCVQAVAAWLQEGRQPEPTRVRIPTPAMEIRFIPREDHPNQKGAPHAR